MIRGYEIGDLARIKLQPEQIAENPQEKYFLSEDTFVIELDGEVLVICRPIFEDESTVQLISVISQYAGRYSIRLTKFAKQIVDALLEDNEKVEITVQEGFKAGSHLAKLLGFKMQGRIINLINGLDYNVWVKEN